MIASTTHRICDSGPYPLFGFQVGIDHCPGHPVARACQIIALLGRQTTDDRRGMHSELFESSGIQRGLQR